MIGPRRRRGAVAALSAVLLIPVLGFAGLAIDLTRLWLVSARLKTSIDAASLLAARTMTSTTRDEDARQIFWANYTSNARSMVFLGSTATEPVIENVGTTRVRVTATATVNKTLFGIVNPSAITLTETTLAERQGTGLELAISLDATYSMLDPAGGGLGTKLDAAKAATATLLGILFGTSDRQPNLWVSVVSFSRTINIGPGNAALLDTTAAPAGFNASRWGGCVRARTNGNDTADLDPAVAGLPPYWWPSTYRQVGTVEAGACSGTANPRRFYPETAVGQPRFCHGDNDWGSGETLSTNTPAPPANTTNRWYNGAYAFWRQNPYLLTVESDLRTAAAGPNFNCSVEPILPLTASRTTVEAAVNAITVQATAGTITPAGLHGAWYTLSPSWQSRWPGIADGGALGALPLAYNTRNMTKAIILLTDGANVWQVASQFGNVRGSATGTELLYSYYGRGSDFNSSFPGNTISPISAVNAGNRMNDRFSAICSAIKATGIVIYVVGFEVPDAARRTLLQNCASGTGEPYYLEAPSAADLNRSFTVIANQLASLRLVE